MKRILSIICVVFITASMTAQTSENPFAGKTYRIDNYINGKLDNSEDLIFTDTDVSGSICLQYGFDETNYSITENDKGNWDFAYTMTSNQHGKMAWSGVLEGDKIKGTYLWTKKGQDDIKYTFKGVLKN